jgi:hypothetical protein
MASPRSYGYEYDEFIFGNLFDLTEGCRMGHWDLTISQDFTQKNTRLDMSLMIMTPWLFRNCKTCI